MPPLEPVSGWQIASTISTSAATVIALVVVVLNLMQRRRDRDLVRVEDEDRARSLATLVITCTGNPGLRAPIDEEIQGLDQPCSVMEIPFENLTSQPVLDVYAEVWHSGMALEDRPSAVHANVVRSGENLPLRLFLQSTPDNFRLSAWRVRWTDSGGRRWCRDRYPQDRPDRFTGQLPSRY